MPSRLGCDRAGGSSAVASIRTRPTTLTTSRTTKRTSPSVGWPARCGSGPGTDGWRAIGSTCCGCRWQSSLPSPDKVAGRSPTACPGRSTRSCWSETDAATHPALPHAPPQGSAITLHGRVEPSELATLRDYLRNYRLTLQMKCEGLDPEKLARPSGPPSSKSLLGLLRHLAEGERAWRNWILPGDPAPKLYGARDADFDGAVAEQALVEDAFADLAREQAATDAVLAEYPDLGARVGQRGIAVRELWVHRIEEDARHCGHADLLRECGHARGGQQHTPAGGRPH